MSIVRIYFLVEKGEEWLNLGFIEIVECFFTFLWNYDFGKCVFIVCYCVRIYNIIKREKIKFDFLKSYCISCVGENLEKK